MLVGVFLQQAGKGDVACQTKRNDEKLFYFPLILPECCFYITKTEAEAENFLLQMCDIHA